MTGNCGKYEMAGFTFFSLQFTHLGINGNALE